MLNENIKNSDFALTAISNLFYQICAVKIPSNTYEWIQSSPQVLEFVKDCKNAQEILNTIVDKLMFSPSKETVLELADISTWPKRFKLTNCFSCEYEGKLTGWNRMSFIELKRDSENIVTDVLVCVQNIDAEKKALVMAEKQINESIGVIEGLSQEYHTLWLVKLEDLSMQLFRSNGKSTIQGAIKMALDKPNYSFMVNQYADHYIVEKDRERVREKAQIDHVLKKISNGEPYVINYLRQNDEGEQSYHQIIYVKTKLENGEDAFVQGFKDIDSVIRRELQDQENYKEQLNIVSALSRDYLNVFLVDPTEKTAKVLKLDGYVTTGLDNNKRQSFNYDALCKKYALERVYPEDVENLLTAMNLETVQKKLKRDGEYIYSYRVFENDAIHNYEFKYIKLDTKSKDSKIIAGFKNIDAIVKATQEKEYLRILSETDSLTNLLNRGSGERMATEAINKGVNGMFCILDVDKFKSINDTYGHQVGDKVLTGIATCLKRTFRDDDIVFRLGGDEFAVFAKNVENESWGKMIIQRFFSRLVKMEIPELDGRKVTVSVGGLVTRDGQSLSFDEIYSKADACVYKSKSISGNAILFHEEDGVANDTAN